MASRDSLPRTLGELKASGWQSVPVKEEIRGNAIELYANATNLFDKKPPVSSLYSPYYDVIGRYVTVGARMRF